MIPPNIALLAWPLVAIWLFRTLPFERAVIWAIIAPFLLLPAGYAIDLPGLPPLSKQSLPNLVLIFASAIFAPKISSSAPMSLSVKILFLFLILGSFITSITNSDPIWIVKNYLPGITFYDSISSVLRTFIFISPIIAGLLFLNDAESHRFILSIILLSGLIYSIPILYEIRMSPQLHGIIYGYFPSSFTQQIRLGGFRPVVFIGHGLGVAFFVFAACVSALGLWKQGKGHSNTAPRSYPLIITYMMTVLILCKSLGSLIFAISCLPIILFLKIRTQVLISAVLATTVLTYPVLRGADLVPTETLLGWAESISAERAASLRVRFENEDILLEHAEQRIVFGWGGWGRNRPYDPETGKNITITDGYWVIVIGTYGWVGYIGTFGLLCLPLFLLWLKLRRDPALDLSPATGALCILFSINLLDLLPNSSIYPWTWLIAGALLGYALHPATSNDEKSPEPGDKVAVQRTIL